MKNNFLKRRTIHDDSVPLKTKGIEFTRMWKLRKNHFILVISKLFYSRVRLCIALFNISRCEYIFTGVKFSLSRIISPEHGCTQNLPNIIPFGNIDSRAKKKNPEDPRWIDDELSGHDSTGKFPRSRNLTGIRLEILEKGVRVILVESCLPFNGNHREKLRGPRWLRTNVRCVAKECSERMARKKNERRTRKDSRIEWSSSSRRYLWKLFYAPSRMTENEEGSR